MLVLLIIIANSQSKMRTFYPVSYSIIDCHCIIYPSFVRHSTKSLFRVTVNRDKDDIYDLQVKILKQERDSFTSEITSASSIRVWTVRGIPKDNPRLDNDAFVESLIGGVG